MSSSQRRSDKIFDSLLTRIFAYRAEVSRTRRQIREQQAEIDDLRHKLQDAVESSTLFKERAENFRMYWMEERRRKDRLSQQLEKLGVDQEHPESQLLAWASTPDPPTFPTDDEDGY
ncbi:hypothetical protein NM688_g1324 [Phlebia brevispora]|uniref:Uncharacterized protein n=1 Tax=Phlebia brevispora TaxID=194682 RepID=A0ACC1TBZ9_9APHY|nr:hypothetical protein NM688_g1324 [Phlebia brevispora]